MLAPVSHSSGESKIMMRNGRESQRSNLISTSKESALGRKLSIRARRMLAGSRISSETITIKISNPTRLFSRTAQHHQAPEEDENVQIGSSAQVRPQQIPFSRFSPKQDDHLRQESSFSTYLSLPCNNNRQESQLVPLQLSSPQPPLSSVPESNFSSSPSLCAMSPSPGGRCQKETVAGRSDPQHCHAQDRKNDEDTARISRRICSSKQSDSIVFAGSEWDIEASSSGHASGSPLACNNIEEIVDSVIKLYQTSPSVVLSGKWLGSANSATEAEQTGANVMPGETTSQEFLDSPSSTRATRSSLLSTCIGSSQQGLKAFMCRQSGAAPEEKGIKFEVCWKGGKRLFILDKEVTYEHLVAFIDDLTTQAASVANKRIYISSEELANDISEEFGAQWSSFRISPAANILDTTEAQSQYKRITPDTLFSCILKRASRQSGPIRILLWDEDSESPTTEQLCSLRDGPLRGTDDSPNDTQPRADSSCQIIAKTTKKEILMRNKPHRLGDFVLDPEHCGPIELRARLKSARETHSLMRHSLLSIGEVSGSTLADLTKLDIIGQPKESSAPSVNQLPAILPKDQMNSSHHPCKVQQPERIGTMRFSEILKIYEEDLVSPLSTPGTTNSKRLLLPTISSHVSQEVASRLSFQNWPARSSVSSHYTCSSSEHTSDRFGLLGVGTRLRRSDARAVIDTLQQKEIELQLAEPSSSTSEQRRRRKHAWNPSCLEPSEIEWMELESLSVRASTAKSHRQKAQNGERSMDNLQELSSLSSPRQSVAARTSSLSSPTASLNPDSDRKEMLWTQEALPSSPNMTDLPLTQTSRPRMKSTTSVEAPSSRSSISTGKKLAASLKGKITAAVRLERSPTTVDGHARFVSFHDNIGRNCIYQPLTDWRLFLFQDLWTSILGRAQVDAELDNAINARVSPNIANLRGKRSEIRTEEPKDVPFEELMSPQDSELRTPESAQSLIVDGCHSDASVSKNCGDSCKHVQGETKTKGCSRLPDGWDQIDENSLPAVRDAIQSLTLAFPTESAACEDVEATKRILQRVSSQSEYEEVTTPGELDRSSPQNSEHRPHPRRSFEDKQCPTERSESTETLFREVHGQQSSSRSSLSSRPRFCESVAPASFSSHRLDGSSLKRKPRPPPLSLKHQESLQEQQRSSSSTISLLSMIESIDESIGGQLQERRFLNVPVPSTSTGAETCQRAASHRNTPSPFPLLDQCAGSQGCEYSSDSAPPRSSMGSCKSPQSKMRLPFRSASLLTSIARRSRR